MRGSPPPRRQKQVGGGLEIDLLLGLLAVLLLSLGTAFFVAGEFALVAVERSKVERLAEDGHPGARRTLQALRTLSFQLSGAQLGITVTALLTGFIVEPTLGEALVPLVERIGAGSSARTISITLALVFATVLQMVLGELLPKNLAVAKPLETALRIASPFRLVNRLWRPVIVFLNAAANGTVRLLGIEPRDELHSTHSLEELEVLIRSSRERGALREADFVLLSRSLSFGAKTAGDALVPRVSVIAVQQDASIADLSRLAIDTGHSRFPVYATDLDDVVGVAHIKDVYSIPTDTSGSVPVSQIARSPLFVPESKPLDALLIQMRDERKQLAVVLDEYGGTAGIITLEDLLEEIVGDIEDEYDPDLAPTRPTSRPSGVHLVNALLRPDELLDETGFELPEGDYDTFAGFLLTLFGRIPNTGDHASYDGWEFKITEMDKNRIARVLVVAPTGTSEEQRA